MNQGYYQKRKPAVQIRHIIVFYFSPSAEKFENIPNNRPNWECKYFAGVF